MTSLNQRKIDHLRACFDESIDMHHDSFAGHKLRYAASPEIARDDVRTDSEFAGRAISAPLIISSMTGGVGQEFCTINRNLARAAEQLRIPLGLGSMKVLLTHPEARASYEVRDVAPTVPIIANLGLVSFNCGLRYDDIDRVIDIVQPSVFGLHLNALQESIQEGGDTDFRGLFKHLEAIAGRCPLPLYVKECGGGIAPEFIYRMADIGVAFVDVSGSDGTSWSAVEGTLSSDPSLGEAFKDFGLPTAWILENIEFQRLGKTRIVASGGVRNGIQSVKALAMGANYVSLARPMLIAAADSTEKVIQAGLRIIHEMRTAMFLVGASRVEELNPSHLIRGRK